MFIGKKQRKPCDNESLKLYSHKLRNAKDCPNAFRNKESKTVPKETGIYQPWLLTSYLQNYETIHLSYSEAFSLRYLMWYSYEKNALFLTQKHSKAKVPVLVCGVSLVCTNLDITQTIDNTFFRLCLQFLPLFQLFSTLSLYISPEIFHDLDFILVCR